MEEKQAGYGVAAFTALIVFVFLSASIWMQGDFTTADKLALEAILVGLLGGLLAWLVYETSRSSEAEDDGAPRPFGGEGTGDP